MRLSAKDLEFKSVDKTYLSTQWILILFLYSQYENTKIYKEYNGYIIINYGFHFVE